MARDPSTLAEDGDVATPRVQRGAESLQDSGVRQGDALNAPTRVQGPLAGAGHAFESVPIRPVQLRGVAETLRIPLAARALGGELFPELAVEDDTAARWLAYLGDDGSRWMRDRHGVYGVLVRTGIFCRLARQFLAHAPLTHVVNLGCGLSNYFQWLDNGVVKFTNADLAEVAALRRRVTSCDDERRSVVGVDLRYPGWWDRLALPSDGSGAPVFLLCEGVLVYLQPHEALSVLAEFGARAPAGSALVFDAVSGLAVGYSRVHPSVRYTHAEFTWGVRRLTELVQSSPRLRLKARYDVMESYGWPYSVTAPVAAMLTRVPLYAVYDLRVAGDSTSGQGNAE